MFGAEKPRDAPAVRHTESTESGRARLAGRSKAESSQSLDSDQGPSKAHVVWGRQVVSGILWAPDLSAAQQETPVGR